MKATHRFTSSDGHTYVGVVLAEADWNAVWFLPMCDDHKTWMKEPVWALGVREI